MQSELKPSPSHSALICLFAMPVLWTLGAFTLVTSRFLKLRYFDPTIYTCAKNREVQFHETSRFFGW